MPLPTTAIRWPGVDVGLRASVNGHSWVSWANAIAQARVVGAKMAFNQFGN